MVTRRPPAATRIIRTCTESRWRERHFACRKPIDSLAGAGVILADVWLDDVKMPVVDSLGEKFLEYVKDGMQVSVAENGEVTVA